MGNFAGWIVVAVVAFTLAGAVWLNPAGFVAGLGRELIDDMLPSVVKAFKPKPWTEEQLRKIRAGEDPFRKRQREH